MSLTHEKISVYKEEEISVNLWCHVCEYMLNSAMDIELHEKYGCCHECWLAFGQARKNEWIAGWRPDVNTINRHKQQRKIINIDIMKLLGE